ncbi:DUF1800 domain-containing protein [Actinokineospora sp.]|uniref:DUF1800 domain-containing protein n=1 Tax=Actinokineospora sp. TaxID=1872133 RepID=UPI004037BF1C
MGPLSERAAARRLIDRFGFGPKPGQLDAAGFDRTLAALLDPGDDPGVRATPAPNLGPDPYGEGKLDKAARRKAIEQVKAQQTTLTLWWLDRMVAADRAAAERLTWFWHGHFATSNQKVRSTRLMQAQHETFRGLGAGDFGALAQAMVTDPALLIWLDGQRNKAGAANENLAREFMELFVLGVGNYTEADIREGARALTGWKVDRRAGTAAVVARQHDAKAKTVLGRTADLDATGFVDVLLAQASAPRFVAKRLWFRLVRAEEPPPDVLDRLVAAYGPNRDVTALLRAIAVEPAFRDEGTTMVKQPVEWAVGLMRALRLTPSALPEKQRAGLLRGLRGMGQVPFLPPSVGGWPAGAGWLTTSAELARLNLARLLAAEADLGSLSGGPDGVAALLGVDAWSPRTRGALDAVAREPDKLVAIAAVAPEYVVSG